jgi:hypothetical protein
MDLMHRIRASLDEGSFRSFRERFVAGYIGK